MEEAQEVALELEQEAMLRLAELAAQRDLTLIELVDALLREVVTDAADD